MDMLNILVIDDDHDFAETLAELLALDGHRTFAVFGGREGLAYLKKNVFDLAFLDIMMPGKGGLDVLWACHSLPIRTNIVLMTANNATHYKDQGKIFHALGVLQKPIDPAQLTQYFELSAQAPGG